MGSLDRRGRKVCAGLVAVLVFGCVPHAADKQARSEAADVLLRAHVWTLRGSPAAEARPGPEVPAEITLEFTADGTVVGSGGCNRYSAEVEIGAAGSLSVGPVGATKKLCPPPVMHGETAFFKALREARRYGLDGARLRLYSGGRVLEFAPAERDGP